MFSVWEEKDQEENHPIIRPMKMIESTEIVNHGFIFNSLISSQCFWDANPNRIKKGFHIVAEIFKYRSNLLQSFICNPMEAQLAMINLNLYMTFCGNKVFQR